MRWCYFNPFMYRALVAKGMDLYVKVACDPADTCRYTTGPCYDASSHTIDRVPPVGACLHRAAIRR